MKVSRRHFLKMMLAAAGATALGWNAAAGLLQEVAGYEQDSPKNILKPSEIPKYTNKLVKPPSFIPDPVTGRFDISASAFTQQILPVTDSSGRPTGYGQTTVFGFGGLVKNSDTGKPTTFRGVPGATFEVVRREPIKVRWINDIDIPFILPVDPTLHWANPNKMAMPGPPFKAFPPGYPDAQSPVPTSIHLHGGETPPEYDGNPDAWFTVDGIKGPEFVTDTYTYPNTQPATTLWYHEHTVGVTRLTMYAGLYGFYLIRDPKDTVMPLLPSGKYEIPMAIQDVMFFETDEWTGNNDLSYPTVGSEPELHPYWFSDVLNDVIVVNGKAWPNLDVDRGQYLFRLLNASANRFYELSFSNGMEFVQIGVEGGYLMSPVKLKSVLISPAERADILVDFSDMEAGEKIILKNSAIATYPDGKPPDPETAGQVMQFTVTDAPGFKPNELPAFLNPYLGKGSFPTLKPGEVQRTLSLVRIPGKTNPTIMLLDGQSWNAPTSEMPVLGETEDWVIANTSASTHPIHIHLVMFQLVSRQKFDVSDYLDAWLKANNAGTQKHPELPLKKTTVNVPLEPYLLSSPKGPDENEQGWKDTVRANNGEVTRVRIRFAAQDGSIYPFDPTKEPGYLWHCHILDHEDNEMMRRFKIVKK
jgi:spore coat protein A